MIEKPRYGQPCNGCGACCREAPCPLGKIVFQQPYGACPAIELDGEKVTCGLVATPIAYNLRGVLEFGHDTVSQAAALLIGAHVGCDTQMNNEIVDPSAVDRLRSIMIDAVSGMNKELIKRAKRIWGFQV